MLAKLRSPTYHVEQNTSEIEQPLQLKDSTAPKSVPPMHWLVVDPNECHSVVSPGDFDRQYVLADDGNPFTTPAEAVKGIALALDAIAALESRVAELNQAVTLISSTHSADTRPMSKATTLEEIQAQATQSASEREGVRFP